MSQARAGTIPFESAGELRKAHDEQLKAVDARLDASDDSNAELVVVAQLAGDIHVLLARGTQAGAFIEEAKDRTACQVLLDYWATALARVEGDRPSAKLEKFDAQRLPILPDDACPYVGLEAFRDARNFHGRDADVRRLLQQFLQSRLVLVTGASGSGKSSLMLAGLLPELRRSGAPFLILPTFVPGDEAVARLLSAVLAAGGCSASELPQLADQLRSAPAQLSDMLASTEHPLLLVIDQFEELFTLNPPEAREQFGALLSALLRAARPHHVVASIREEFRSRLVELRALDGLLDQAWYAMRPMSYDELRAAVELPARTANLHIQAGVVDDLVKKVLGQPTALPLLQFTLKMLWSKRERNRITREVYARVGDPLTALQTHADAFFEGKTPQTRQEVKRILLSLVRIDSLLEAYRLPVLKSRLLEAGKADTEEVLGLLEQADYVRISPARAGADSVVEIKHEALIRNWPTLVKWIDEKRLQLRERLTLTEAAQRWDRAGRPAEGLLTGWQIEHAAQQGDLSALEASYLEASAQALSRAQFEREEALRQEANAAREAAHRAKELERKQRQLRRLAVIALGIAVFVGLCQFWYFQHKSSQQERVATTLSQETEQLDRRNATLLAENDALNTKSKELDQLNTALKTANAALQNKLNDVLSHTGQRGMEETRRQLLAIGIAAALRSDDPLSAAGKPVGTAPQAKPQEAVFIHFVGETQRQLAEQLRDALKGRAVDASIEDVALTKKNPPSITEVRYFWPSDSARAGEIAKLLESYSGAEIRTVAMENKQITVSPGRYMIWFSAGLKPPGTAMAQQQREPSPPQRRRQP